MFATKLGARARGVAVVAGSHPSTLAASARLFASSAPRSIDRDAAPSKPDVVDVSRHLAETPSPPATPAGGSAVPLSLKTASHSNSSSNSGSTSSKGPMPTSSPAAGPSNGPRPTSSTVTAAALPSTFSASPNRGKAAFALPTVLSQDWLFASSPSSSAASLTSPAAAFMTEDVVDPDAPDSSLWALESEIITWFPPSHPHIGRSTPASAHAEVLAAAAASSKVSSTRRAPVVFDEDETYFTHSLFRQLAVSHLSSQATADRGISPAGRQAIRLMAEYEQAVRRRTDDEQQTGGEGIRLDSVVRKRKKKMSKHKYKKRIKVRLFRRQDAARPLRRAIFVRTSADIFLTLILSLGPEGAAEEARQVS